MKKIVALLAQCGNWFFPPSCCLCNHLLLFNEVICQKCWKVLPWNERSCKLCGLPIEAATQCGGCLNDPPVFSRGIAPFRYEPPISTFIIQLKFQHQLRYARVLGRLLAESIRKQLCVLPECLIPIPLHHHRLRKRGFNQAIEIAKILSKELHIPLLYDHCYRRKNTVPQSELSARARRRNLRAAFDIRKKIPFQHVAIIDDVMTTGQTVRVFSQMLRQKGVQEIEVWCCARAV